jgi:hypothetical protein
MCHVLGRVDGVSILVPGDYLQAHGGDGAHHLESIEVHDAVVDRCLVGEVQGLGIARAEGVVRCAEGDLLDAGVVLGIERLIVYLDAREVQVVVRTDDRGDGQGRSQTLRRSPAVTYSDMRG